MANLFHQLTVLNVLSLILSLLGLGFCVLWHYARHKQWPDRRRLMLLAALFAAFWMIGDWTFFFLRIVHYHRRPERRPVDISWQLEQPLAPYRALLGNTEPSRSELPQPFRRPA